MTSVFITQPPIQQMYTSLSGRTINLPDISISVPYLGTISITSINIVNGYYDPKNKLVRVNEGKLFYTGGAIGGPASISNFVIQSTLQGAKITGKACIKHLWEQCENVNTTINYTSSLSESQLISYINAALGQKVGHNNQYNQDYCMRIPGGQVCFYPDVYY